VHGEKSAGSAAMPSGGHERRARRDAHHDAHNSLSDFGGAELGFGITCASPCAPPEGGRRRPSRTRAAPSLRVGRQTAMKVKTLLRIHPG
jgi:hypothetical protein